MPRAAVLGFPVEHSLSPVLHEAGYAAAGLTDWTYTRHAVREAELAGFVAELPEDWRGLSLTMPLKEAAFAVADSVADVARRARAINTLVRRADGGWDGTNTDVLGIVRALGPVPSGRRATILGSGATARSALLALADLGVGEVVVAARNAGAAAGLIRLGATLGLAVRHTGLTDWAGARGAIVVSTLPPAGSQAAAEALGSADLPGVRLLDVVYANWPTPLARAAEGHGADVVSGLDMLVHQAAEQFRLFTGVEPDLEAMFAAGRADLRA